MRDPNAYRPGAFHPLVAALTPLGVANALADPTLELYQGQTKVAENDDWSGTALRMV